MKKKVENLSEGMFQKFENHRIQNLQQVLGGRHWVTNSSSVISNGQADGCDVAKWSFPDDSNSCSLDGIYRCDLVLPPEPTWNDLPFGDTTAEVGDELVTNPATGELIEM